MKAPVFQLASPTDVHWTMSGEVVMVLIGGTGTLFGPALGALVIMAMEFYLAPIGSWLTVIFVGLLSRHVGILARSKPWAGGYRAGAPGWPVPRRRCTRTADR